MKTNKIGLLALRMAELYDEGLFIYYVSMNNQWSLFKKMTKDDGGGTKGHQKR